MGNVQSAFTYIHPILSVFRKQTVDPSHFHLTPHGVVLDSSVADAVVKPKRAKGNDDETGP